jgi:hypothetical protein
MNNEQRPTTKVIDWCIYVQVENERENNFVVFGSFFLVDHDCDISRSVCVQKNGLARINPPF